LFPGHTGSGDRRRRARRADPRRARRGYSLEDDRRATRGVERPPEARRLRTRRPPKVGAEVGRGSARTLSYDPTMRLRLLGAALALGGAIACGGVLPVGTVDATPDAGSPDPSDAAAPREAGSCDPSSRWSVTSLGEGINVADNHQGAPTLTADELTMVFER